MLGGVFSEDVFVPVEIGVSLSANSPIGSAN
jgi:hypothetical protein